MKSSQARSVRGSALLLVLWALLVLSAVVFAWVKTIQRDIEVIRQDNAGLDAKALAHSGVELALHPLVSPQTPLLSATLGALRGFDVRLTGEGGRLNLNWLLQGAEQDPRLHFILDTYLSRRGLSMKERATLIDCLLDWIQPGNLHHLNGAEDSPTYKNAHRPLQSLDEVEKVKGSGPLVSQPDWKDDFTLYSQGPVDLQAASQRVLQAIPGIGDALAARFIAVRQGPDHLDGTRDDHIFKDIGEARLYLGLNEEQFKALNGLVMVKDPTYHILSVGRSDNVYRRVEVVARKDGAVPNILLWKES